MLCVHVTNERAVMPGHLGLNVLARRDQFPSTVDVMPAGCIAATLELPSISEAWISRSGETPIASWLLLSPRDRRS